MAKKSITTEEALGTLSPREMIRYVMQANLDSMEETYAERLNPLSRRKILAERQLDLTDPYQRIVGKNWIKEK